MVLVIGGKHVELVGRLATVVTYGLDNWHLKLHPHKSAEHRAAGHEAGEHERRGELVEKDVVRVATKYLRLEAGQREATIPASKEAVRLRAKGLSSLQEVALQRMRHMQYRLIGRMSVETVEKWWILRGSNS